MAQIIILVLTSLILFSCGDTLSESNEASRLQNLLEINVYLNDDLATLHNRSETIPTNVTNVELPRLTAILTVDDGDDQVMQMTSLTAKMTLPTLKFDLHDFSIRFFYALDDNPDNNILLSDVNINTKDRKINIHTEEITISSLVFDDDGDGVSNLKELVLGTNPKNPAPTIVSLDNVIVLENSIAVLSVTAIAPNPEATLNYRISGGLDQTLFSINSTTGELSFIQAPNFQAPTDNGGNNIYDVQVAVSDGNLSYFQDIVITITDVFDLKYSIGVKQINFNWLAYEDAMLYKVLESKDCINYTAIDDEIYVGGALLYNLEIAIHLYPTKSCFYLQVYDSGQSLLATTPIIYVNILNDANNLLGIDYKKDYLPIGSTSETSKLSISDDGKTFVVGLPNFASSTGVVYLYRKIGDENGA